MSLPYMSRLANLEPMDLEIILESSGLDIGNVNLFEVKNVRFHDHQIVYKVFGEEDDTFYVTEVYVGLTRDGSIGADFAGCPDFESIDGIKAMSFFRHGPDREPTVMERNRAVHEFIQKDFTY